jgi:plastocyanin
LRTWTIILLGGLAVAAGLAGVGALRTPPTVTAVDVPHESTLRVVMDGTRFRPSEATVAPGDTVIWANLDPFPHNVYSEAGHFTSGNLAPDGTWLFRPTERGTFEYHCTLHPGMKAVLRVR